jgi:hypothetical protein
MVKKTIATAKMKITVLHDGDALICVDTLDRNGTFTQNHFINIVLPDLKKPAHDLRGRKRHFTPTKRCGPAVGSSESRGLEPQWIEGEAQNDAKWPHFWMTCLL